MTAAGSAARRNGSTVIADGAIDALSRLQSRLDRAPPEFQVNAAAMRSQADLLRDRYALVQQGGGEEQTRRHRSRGKLPARERIERLLDPDAALAKGQHPGQTTRAIPGHSAVRRCTPHRRGLRIHVPSRAQQPQPLRPHPVLTVSPHDPERGALPPKPRPLAAPGLCRAVA